MLKAQGCAAIALIGLVMIPGVARAADTTIGAGQDYSLPAALVLAGSDNFNAGATAGARCKLHGAGFAISSAPGWTGSVTIRNCDIDGMGDANTAAILVSVVGTATVTIQGSTFSTSGRVDVTASDQSTVIVQNNTVTADSLVPAVTLLMSSQPAFQFAGPSTGTKQFQGNVLLKSRAAFGITSGWLIGGDTPAQGNILVGLRAGFDLARVADIQVRGNYSHTMRENEDWNQVKNLSIIEASNVVVEHNVFWGLNWLLEVKGGADIRYNLLLDNVERGWVLVWDDAGAKVHHNVMVSTRDNGFSPAGAIVVETGADTTMMTPQILDVYNNTFDGAGKCNRPIDGAVVLHGSFLSSLRSNAFVGARVASGGDANALVHGASTSLTPLAPGLGYSDYNLFYNPDSPVTVIYGTGVQGKTARTDPGFGFHDAMPGGVINQQVDPKFASAMLPRTFPFKESDVIARTTTVCQVLAYYRQLYSPGSGSPLLGGGDPADGPGNIGAVGAGEATDLFGKYCDPTDIGQPDTSAAVATCPDVTMTGAGGNGGNGGNGGGGTGAGGMTGPHVVDQGFKCVCTIDPARPLASDLGELAAVGLAALALLGTRRRRASSPPRS